MDGHESDTSSCLFDSQLFAYLATTIYSIGLQRIQSAKWISIFT